MNNRKHGDEQTRSCKCLGQQPKDDLWGHPFVPLFSGCLWGNSVKVAYCFTVFGPAGTSQRVVLWAHPGPWYPWGQSYRSAQLTPFYPTKEESSAQAHRPSTGPLWYQGQQSLSFLHKEGITRIRVPLSIPWLHQLWAKRPNWSKIITPALTHFKTTSPRLPILACTQRIPLYFFFLKLTHIKCLHRKVEQLRNPRMAHSSQGFLSQRWHYRRDDTPWNKCLQFTQS